MKFSKLFSKILKNRELFQMKRLHKKCHAHARSTGLPCKAKALSNGRCRNHGGLSTGPKTQAGKLAIALATKRRMATGQLQAAKEGFRRWLITGGHWGLKPSTQIKASNSSVQRLIYEKISKNKI
jgi:hypothetical protein